MDWNKAGIKLVDSSPVENAPEYASFPAFAPLLSDAFDYLKNLPEKSEVPVGTCLINQGSTGETVTLIASGLVKLVCSNSEGRQATLGLRTSGWYAGAVFVLMNTPSVYTAITVTPCTIIRIPAHEFSLKLMQSARLMRHFLSTVCNEMISQSSAQAEVMTGSAEERLAHFMRERNSEHPKWKVLDTLPLLKQVELAQLLSITPEHLSRLLHKDSPTPRTRREVTPRPPNVMVMSKPDAADGKSRKQG